MNYSGDPKTGHVRILNGRPLSDFQIHSPYFYSLDHLKTDLLKSNQNGGHLVFPDVEWLG